MGSIALLISATEKTISKGFTLSTNLLPCPAMVCRTLPFALLPVSDTTMRLLGKLSGKRIRNVAGQEVIASAMRVKRLSHVLHGSLFTNKNALTVVSVCAEEMFQKETPALKTLGKECLQRKNGFGFGVDSTNCIKVHSRQRVRSVTKET